MPDYCYDGAMPHQFRTADDRSRKAGEDIELTLADGTKVQGTWAGSAKEEMLEWWLSRPGNELAQTEQISEVAIKADDDHEMLWGAAPVGAQAAVQLGQGVSHHRRVLYIVDSDELAVHGFGIE